MNILKKLRRDSNGFGHIETILIVLVVAAIAASGFFVYQHQKKHTTAHAGGWTYIYGNPTPLQYGGNVLAYGCKAQWGSLEQIKVAYVKTASTPAYWYNTHVTGLGSNSPTLADAGWSNAYYGGTIAVQTVTFNAYSFYNLRINIQSATGSNFIQANIAGWANC